MQVALSSQWQTVRQAGLDLLHQAVGGEHGILSSVNFASDDTLLSLTMASLLPVGVDPSPLVTSWTWRVLVEALLSRAAASSLPPPPFPASISFVAARLVAGRAHLQVKTLSVPPPLSGFVFAYLATLSDSESDDAQPTGRWSCCRIKRSSSCSSYS